MDIDIIQLSPDNWQQYRELRLEALKSDQEAFGLLYEEAVDFPKEKWIEPLIEAEETKDKWIYFARLNNKLVGMTSGKVIDQDTVKLGEVFVVKEARGKGVGKKLLSTLINEVKRCSHLKRVKAKVFISQKPAIQLYESVGFKIEKQITEDWPDGRTNETFVMYKHIND